MGKVSAYGLVTAKGFRFLITELALKLRKEFRKFATTFRTFPERLKSCESWTSTRRQTLLI